MIVFSNNASRIGLLHPLTAALAIGYYDTARIAAAHLDEWYEMSGQKACDHLSVTREAVTSAYADGNFLLKHLDAALSSRPC